MNVELTDAILMRVARRVRPNSLYPLAANLLVNVDYLEDIKADFAEMKTAEIILLNMVEWKRRLVNERGDVSTRTLIKVIKESEIDEHIMCQVYDENEVKPRP